MRTATFIAFAAGLTLFVAILVYHGLDDVLAAVASMGWGLAAAVGFHLAPLAMDAEAWRLLFARDRRPGLGLAMFGRWIAEAVNGLLPAAQVGGEFVRARLVAQRGVPAAAAGAAVAGDVTVGLVTQIVFAILGLFGLAYLQLEGHDALLWPLVLGIGALTGLTGLFFLTQRAGIGRVSTRLLDRVTGGRFALGRDGGGENLDREISAVYGRRRGLAAAALWRMGGWLVGTGEIWLALWFLGHPIGWAEAVVFESLLQLIRSAAFVVPAAIGVQEGGFMLLATLFGLGPETGLALALVKRVRELTFGVPGLLAWQFSEGWTARLRRRAAP